MELAGGEDEYEYDQEEEEEGKDDTDGFDEKSMTLLLPPLLLLSPLLPLLSLMLPLLILLPLLLPLLPLLLPLLVLVLLLMTALVLLHCPTSSEEFGCAAYANVVIAVKVCVRLVENAVDIARNELRTVSNRVSE